MINNLTMKKQLEIQSIFYNAYTHLARIPLISPDLKQYKYIEITNPKNNHNYNSGIKTHKLHFIINVKDNDNKTVLVLNCYSDFWELSNNRRFDVFMEYDREKSEKYPEGCRLNLDLNKPDSQLEYEINGTLYSVCDGKTVLPTITRKNGDNKIDTYVLLNKDSNNSIFCKMIDNIYIGFDIENQKIKILNLNREEIINYEEKCEELGIDIQSTLLDIKNMMIRFYSDVEFINESYKRAEHDFEEIIATLNTKLNIRNEKFRDKTAKLSRNFPLNIVDSVVDSVQTIGKKKK